MFHRVEYQNLNSRQKENYNFQKVSAELADYGFNCMRLNDDWQGADFIACHINGSTFLKVQLKGRLTIEKKYNDKEIFIAFREEAQWYIYPHDIMQQSRDLMAGSESWEQNGGYSWPRIPKSLMQFMQEFAI
jgi:hypothetical protein